MAETNLTGAGSIDEQKLQEPQQIEQPGVAPDADTGVFKIKGVNDQQSFQQPTPAPVETTPVETAPTPTEPTPVEPTPTPTPTTNINITPTPKVEPTVKPVEDTKKQDTPVVDAQTVKSNEIANQSAQDTLDEQNKIKATDEFAKMVQSGASLEDLADFGSKNIQYRDSFNSVLKDHFKTSSNTKYFGKYSNMSNDDLLAEINAGNVVIGSEQYNLLPETKRASIELFKKQNEATTVNEPTDFTAGNKVTSLTDIVSQLQGLFSFDLRGKSQSLLNTPQINNLTTEIADKKAEIEKFDIEMEDTETNIRKELAGNLPGAVNAAVRDANRDNVKQKRLLLAEYNAKIGEYQTLKSNAQTEIDFLKYEDQQNKAIYTTALSMYETRRGEMREDEKLKFLEDSKKQAEARALSNQKSLAEFNKKLREDSKTGGKYIDDGEGNLVYLKDGEQISVLTGLGETVATSEDENYTWQTKKNEDGTYTVFGMPKEGTNIVQYNYGVNGEQSTSWIQGTGTGKITSYGGVHDNYQGLDIDGDVGDPISTPLGGEVLEVQSHTGYGTTMVVKLEDGNKVRYSHLDRTFLKPGDSFAKGSIVASIGNTGNVLKLDGTKPSKAELNAGFGSHLDIVTTGPDGIVRSSKQTEQYLNNIGIDNDSKTNPNKDLAQGIIDGTSKLTDFTPTLKAKIVPELNKLINSQLTDDENRNIILKSSTKTKDISDTALQKIADMETVKFQLSNLEETLASADTGPVLGILNGKNPYNAQSQLALAQLAGLTPKVARGIFGEVGVLTDTDIKNYQRALPNLQSTEEKNALVIDFMRDLLTEGYKNSIAVQAKGGRNMSQFLDDYDLLTSGSRVNKYINTGKTITTTSGFTLSSGSTKAQDDFFNNNN